MHTNERNAKDNYFSNSPPVTDEMEYVTAEESSVAVTVKTLVPTAAFSSTAALAGAVLHAGFSSFRLFT